MSRLAELRKAAEKGLVCLESDPFVTCDDKAGYCVVTEHGLNALLDLVQLQHKANRRVFSFDDYQLMKLAAQQALAAYAKFDEGEK